MTESRRMTKSQRMAARKHKSSKKVGLSDLIKREQEHHDKMNIEFSWPDLCKYIPKCILYRAKQLRLIAEKALGQCSYKVINKFLMFSFELLIGENTVTTEKFRVLKERAENLTFEDAQTIFKIVVIIRKKFNESVIRPVNNNKHTGEDKIPDNLFGLKFEYKSAMESNSEKRTVPLENTDHSVNNFSIYKTEETKPLRITAESNRAEYLEKFNEYYEKYSPAISRERFQKTIVETLRSKNSQSELIDLIGFEAMEFLEYIIKNQESITALNFDI